MRGFKKATAAVLAAIMVAGCLTGCGGNKEKPAGGGEKADSNIVKLAMGADVDNLDGSRCNDAQKGQIVLEAQETLVRFSAEGELEAAGAESWETSEDGLTWTFHLRDNKYSDGTPVTAQDYVNGITRTLDPVVGSTNAGTWYVIKGAEAFNTGNGTAEDFGVKATDDKTIEVTLEKPLPYFLQMVNSANFTPIPEAHTEGDKTTTYGTSTEGMLFSGPFVIDSWTRGSGIKMSKNPNYWDADSVKIDGIDLKIVQEENTKQQMLDQGELSLLEEATAEYLEKQQAKIDSNELRLSEIPQTSVSYICFNNQDKEGIFSNAKIRKAFSLAVDRDTYIDKVLRKNVPAYSLIPFATNNGDSLYRDKVAEPLKEFADVDVKALYEEGLKEIGKAGEEVTITFLQGNANNDTKVKSEFFQNQWESKLGVKVVIDTAADNATFNTMVSKGEYQICNTGWGADYNDPMTFMQLFVTGDGNNAPFFSNARYDELITACASESDMAVRFEKFEEAEKILLDEAGVAPLNFGVKKSLIQGNLENIRFNSAGGPPVELKTACFTK